MTELRLQAVLEPMGPAGAIVLDDDPVALLSTAKAFPVVVTIDARTARLRLARMRGRTPPASAASQRPSTSCAGSIRPAPPPLRVHR